MTSKPDASSLRLTIFSFQDAIFWNCLASIGPLYRRAIGDHHFTAAARAVELQARLGGKIVRDMPQIIEEAEKGAALDPGAGQKAVTEIEQ